MPGPPRTCGWDSDLPTFRDTQPRVIRIALEDFVRDASPEQVRAWKDSIPWLQRETGEFVASDQGGETYTAILEYRLPLDSRRPDVVVLLNGPVVVMELKGKEEPSQADLDQVAAYARDLRCYHRECETRPVHAVLVPTRARSLEARRDGIHVVSPDVVDRLLRELCGTTESGGVVDPRAFLDIGAYRPLPSLVQAARELFESRKVRDIWRARAHTDPAVDAIGTIAREAAARKTRHLVLVTGVPGSGKTLVGLRAVHSQELDTLALPRESGTSSVPAVFLSGNGPLVEVLQYQLRGAGGGGRTFVRAVRDYLDAYVAHPAKVPSEHVIVFDEAQRAFSAAMVADKHRDWPAHLARSEPELFLRLGERIPEWCVVVGLIGGGQEIHKGEEEGLAQWGDALSRCRDPWTVHGPAEIDEVFRAARCDTEWNPALKLDTEIRFHLTADLHRFVASILDGVDAAENERIADRLIRPPGMESGGLRLYATRSLETAKRYLRERYAEQPDARYGLVASSKDKCLQPHFGIPNDFQSTKRVRYGRWYGEGENGPHSCRHLETVVTEFGAQGLELDMALLAWGTDLLYEEGTWSSARAGRYRGRVAVKDPHQLRLNAYRVLLTRGRDGTVIFVPNLPDLDETYAYLTQSGFRPLK